MLNSLERRNEDGVDEFFALCEEHGVASELLCKRSGVDGEELELYRMFRPGA